MYVTYYSVKNTNEILSFNMQYYKVLSQKFNFSVNRSITTS